MTWFQTFTATLLGEFSGIVLGGLAVWLYMRRSK